MSLLSEPVAVVRVQCKPVHLSIWSSSHLSTLPSIQLAERFYDPLSGSILIDDQPISELNVQEYRKHLALVSQEPVSVYNLCSLIFCLTSICQTLYAGSIRFNVLLGATKPVSEVTQEELEEACRDANILEFIQSLPE
jgi:ATP-binding cassette subfamily B (MDR/TAP) protein 1